MNGCPVEWTTDQVATVKDLWGRGFSAGQITRELPFTRNAVISKLNRLGLIGQRRAPQPTGKPKPEPKAQRVHPFRAPKPPKIEPAPEPTIEEIASEGVLLVDFTNQSCRWPHGGFSEPAVFYCGIPTADLIEGKPYCPYHTRLARRA